MGKSIRENKVFEVFLDLFVVFSLVVLLFRGQGQSVVCGAWCTTTPPDALGKGFVPEMFRNKSLA